MRIARSIWTGPDPARSARSAEARLVGALCAAALLAGVQPASAGKEKPEPTKAELSVGPNEGKAGAAKRVGSPKASKGDADREAPAAAERRVPERLRHESREADDGGSSGVRVRGWDPKRKEASPGAGDASP